MDRSYLVLDIETVLDPELPIVEANERDGLPAPPHHEIVCIGVLWLAADHSVRRLGIIGEGKAEPGILEDFCQFMDRHRPTMVTFNGRGFDLPVIVSRCLKHAQPFSYYFRDKDVRYRFSAFGHLDLMDYLSDFGAAKRSSLNVIAKLCGMPGKVGVDGKDVGPMIHAGRIAEVQNYCLCDVVQTAAVFLRTQVLRGELNRDEYLDATQSLMNAASADPRLVAVSGAWNARALTLQGETTAASSDRED
jgi:3'-5' exonuclease